MKESVLHKNNIGGGVHRNKLWLCLALGVLVLAIGCKQVNDGGQNPSDPIESNEVTITVKGDDGVTVNKSNTIKIKKNLNLTWKDIRKLAEAKLILKENFEIKEWRIKDEKGKVLQDVTSFEKDEIVFAITKEKETQKITITVAGDEGVEVASTNNFKVDKGSKWENIKTQAIEKAKVKENFEIKEWHLNNADGTIIKDETEFKENATVFAVSKGKIVGYKVEHLKENIEDENYTKAEEETKTGEAGKNTSAEAKQYEGFSCQGLFQAVIKADGSTVVQIKYKRNITTLILDLDGGKTTSTTLKDGEGGKKLLEGKFGSRVEVKGLEKEGYGFEKWEPELPQSFPATSSNTIYKVKWQNFVYRITIAGDERVKVAEPNYIDVPPESNKKFEDIKAEILAKVSLKSKWSDLDYTFYDWRIGEEKGKEMLDSTPINGGMVVYARTNYKRFKLDGTILIGYEGKKPRGRIFIPKEIIGIKDNTFEYCKDLTAVDLTDCDKLTEIGREAFCVCSNLKNVNLTGCTEIKTIGQNAFKNCASLEGIDLSSCTKLTKLDLGGAAIKNIVLSSCTELMEIGFAECKDLESIDLSSCTKLAEIGQEAFSSCRKLKNINLTGCTEITSIGWRAFMGCNSLEGIDLSSCTKLAEIWQEAFSSCYKLKNVDLTGCTEITSIGWNAFEDCSSLESIDLSSCTKLTKLDLGGTAIKNIDLSSCAELMDIGFAECKNLESIDLSSCTKLTKLNLYGTAIKNIDLSLCTELMDIGFARCEYLESIDLSSCTKLVVISDDTFSGCSEADVELPASITEIRNNAFGEDLDTYCKKVLVPNAGIKQLVVNSGYPEERIELY